MEIDAPEPGKFDTSKTFEITGLGIKKHVFQSVKSKLRVSLLNKNVIFKSASGIYEERPKHIIFILIKIYLFLA